MLPNPHTDPNLLKNGEAVIHKFAKMNNYNLMLALLLYSSSLTEIDITDASDGNTPLHIAAEVC